MPIRRTEETVLCHFGFGDIAVCIGGVVGGPAIELLFYPGEPQTIGEEPRGYIGADTTTVVPAVRMVFDTLASIDVVLRKLAVIKESLITVCDNGHDTV